MIKHLCFITLLTAICSTGFAQSTVRNTSDGSFARVGISMDKRNAIYVGSLMQDFNATTTDGKPFNNSSLRNKVTIVVFWYPSCNCFHFHELDSVAKAFQGTKDVQIVAIGADTFDLASYRRTSYMPYPYAMVSSYSILRDLNYQNGIPTIFIINREGIIAKIKAGPDREYTRSFIDTIRELLL